jgi:putative membrane protein
MMNFHVEQLVASLLYAAVGLVVFAIAWKIAEKLLPFNLIKELTEDDNVAVGIVMAAVILGLALIVASAIHG